MTDSNSKHIDNRHSSSADLQVRIRQREPISMDATLHCDSGEMLALVGPSGSGKSTLLRSIAGLHRLEQTHIRCGGELWDDTPTSHHVKPQQRKVGLVFQEYALFPHKSALDNVMLATPGKTRKLRHSKAMALLEKTNMSGLEQRRPETLSGGQKQRVALARALAREPRVLLLDEPFSAVDQQTRRKLYSELAALRQSLALPIILVTHDLTEVQLLADSLCLMHRGKTLQQGHVTSVINFPDTREIARLVGHQNLFHATIVQHDVAHTLYKLGDVAPFKGPLMPQIAVGEQISLLFAPSAIEVLKPAIPSQSLQPDSSEPIVSLKGRVQEWVSLGDEMSIRLHLQDVPKSLRFKLPLHIAHNENIRRGSSLTIGIRSHGIHAMAS